MKCSEIQDLFGVYFDLPEDDPLRISVDAHVKGCQTCREEHEIWIESTALIQTVRDIPLRANKSTAISNRVMSQIYETESWRMPVHDRIYAIPYKLRRNLTAVIALCLAVFMFSFLYSIVNGGTGNTMLSEQSPYGFHQAANASANTVDLSLNVHSMTRTAFATTNASMIEPLKLGPIHSYPDYFLALSLLGLISTLLIMNWFSRTRA
jgi:predicted anti-sigma-YlaC factor YlaD